VNYRRGHLGRGGNAKSFREGPALVRNFRYSLAVDSTSCGLNQSGKHINLFRDGSEVCGNTSLGRPVGWGCG